MRYHRTPEDDPSFLERLGAGWHTCPVIALVVGVVLARHRTVAGGIIGIVVLLIIIGLIVLLLVSRSKEKARAESAERELAGLKQAYAQLVDAYQLSQSSAPAQTVEKSWAPPQTPPTQQPSSLPRYPGTPPAPGRPPS